MACAVEGLQPEHVTIVDMSGGLLSKGNEDNNVGSQSRAQFDYQRQMEASLEKRIQTMLEPVIGLNKVVARVSAQVDFRHVNIKEERYDPDSLVIRSEQRQKETSNGGESTPTGSPDLKYQVYNSQERSSVSTQNFQKENATINYEINRTNKHIVGSVGDIKRLSAAVIIDGPYMTQQDPNGHTIQKFVPRNRKDMKTFEDIIKKAIGFDEKRGDQVNVTNTPFALQEENLPIPESNTSWLSYIKRGSKPLLNIILIGLFFLLAIRPFKRWLNQAGEVINQRALLENREIPQLEASQRDIFSGQESKRRLLEDTKGNPGAAADIIRHWINEVG